MIGMKVAKKYVVSGRVQGVGYRFFAERVAQELGMGGYVKNLWDGRVEVYGPQVFSQYLRVSYLASGWQDVIAQAHPDAIVLPSAHPLTGILGHDPAWTMLSRDEVATVFIRVGFAQ